jgi:hypothetical protein
MYTLSKCAQTALAEIRAIVQGYVGVTRKLQVSFCMVYYDSFICTCMRGDVSKSVTRVEHLQSVGRVESKGNSSVQECLYLL